jgi:hypothetical protein
VSIGPHRPWLLVGLISKARPEEAPDMLGEPKLDLIEENVDHFEVCRPNMTDLSYNVTALSKSDFKADREVFMVGQGNVPTDQMEEEIAEATAAEVARSERLARNVEKAARKRHMSPRDQNNDLANSDEDGGDGTAFVAPPQVRMMSPCRLRGGRATPGARSIPSRIT